jgi:hypothetical protein
MRVRPLQGAAKPLIRLRAGVRAREAVTFRKEPRLYIGGKRYPLRRVGENMNDPQSAEISAQTLS